MLPWQGHRLSRESSKRDSSQTGSIGGLGHLAHEWTASREDPYQAPVITSHYAGKGESV